MGPCESPNREIVFRVRVVRDVRAKLCASHPGYPGLATVPCPTAPPAAAPADRAPGLSRGCPVGCPVVFPWLSHLFPQPPYQPQAGLIGNPQPPLNPKPA